MLVQNRIKREKKTFCFITMVHSILERIETSFGILFEVKRVENEI